MFKNVCGGVQFYEYHFQQVFWVNVASYFVCSYLPVPNYPLGTNKLYCNEQNFTEVGEIIKLLTKIYGMLAIMNIYIH
jgi:hypothetical protein